LDFQEYKCTEEVLSIISMLSIESIFFVPRGRKQEAKNAHRKFMSEEGDHIMLLNVFKSYAASGYSHAWCRENFINARSLAQSKVSLSFFLFVVVPSLIFLLFAKEYSRPIEGLL
jgi:HrpA-like RNA helicase